MNRRATGFSRFRRRERTPVAGLFRRVVLINGLIFTLGTLVLAVSPATVSSRIKLTEIPVLAVGLAVMLSANALLLRSSLAPLDRLAASMRRHRTNILQKLGLRDRLALTRYAIRAGLIEP